MAIYGNRQLSIFFFPVVELLTKGFVLKGRHYTWGDVEKVDVRGESRFPFAGPMGGSLQQVPVAEISLRDGKAIRIKAVAFEKKGEPLLDGYSSAFDEVVAIFKKNMKQSRSGRQP